MKTLAVLLSLLTFGAVLTAAAYAASGEPCPCGDACGCRSCPCVGR